MTDNEIQLATSVHDDVTSWFFEDYLPTWVGVAAGTIARGPEFILDYWAAPLHLSTEQGGQWFRDASAVVQFLEEIKSGFGRKGMAIPTCRTTRSAYITTTARLSRSSGHAVAPMAPRSSGWQRISKSAVANGLANRWDSNIVDDCRHAQRGLARKHDN